MPKKLYTGSEWSVETIQRIHDACGIIADKELGLDTYVNQFEIIPSEDMLDAYASVGMPINYGHWSFGKKFVQEEANYRAGRSGLAYELVINSDPCINYLMEENSATVQAIVIAHAGFGHNHFFKNNYMFKEWTNADSIIDYLDFAKNYIAKCEERYGRREVEKILDSCHALQMQGIDRYKRPTRISAAEEAKRAYEKDEYLRKQVNPLFDNITMEATNDGKTFPLEPEENILKFIEKHSPVLDDWQREVVRIVRMVAQYFYPQRQTKVMNEGFACWTHCYMMDRLYDKGYIDEGAMLEFKDIHSGVVFQPSYNSQYYSGFNPYALGLEMFRDIERMCKAPTDEDREWFPDLVGKDHVPVILDAVENYRDESFIRQFLSPHLIRKFRMFNIKDKDDEYYKVANIHNTDGYKSIRDTLAKSYEASRIDPNIQIINANMDSDRHLELHHYAVDGRLLSTDDALECLRHIKRLWGFDPYLISFDEDGKDIDEFIL